MGPRIKLYQPREMEEIAVLARQQEAERKAKRTLWRSVVAWGRRFKLW